MMWIEAALASLLLALAMLLLLQAPAAPSPLLDQVATLQLEDHAALLAEFGSDPLPGGPNLTGTALSDDLLKAKIFPNPQPFCYQWYWSSSDPILGAALQNSSVSYSEDACSQVFDNHPAVIRQISRGAWRDGSLQFLHLKQASAYG